MDLITIDFETFYDQDYSLSKMTTEAYVRDPRFEVIGVGLKVNKHPTDWYSGEHVGRFLNSISYADKAILCHNTVFDGSILSWHFGIKPRLWFDTLSMARPKNAMTNGLSLHKLAHAYGIGVKGTEVIAAKGKRRADFSAAELAAYGGYCCNDVDLTYKLFSKLRADVPVSELQLIDLTLRMFTEPAIELDRALLEQHLHEVRERKTNLVSAMGLDCTEEEAKTILLSNPKFADYLLARGVMPPKKISPATGKSTFAFSKADKAFTELLMHDEAVSNAVAARLGVKSTLEETRTQALLGVSERGPLPILLNYYGAHTGRFSGGDKMNLQNLPRGGALRRSLVAPEGYAFVAADSSQIEARVVAWVSGQADLVKAFAEKRDVYSEFASEVYGRKVDRKLKAIHPVTGEEFYPDLAEGFVGKTAILGLGYGMGAVKFRETLSLGLGGPKVTLSEEEAKAAVGVYRRKNFRIQQFWRTCGIALGEIIAGREFPLSDALPSLRTSAEGIALPNGMFIRYPLLCTVGDRATGYAYCSDQRMYRKALMERIMGPVDIEKFTRIYGGKVTENIVQALARIVVSEQMQVIASVYKVVLQVHDEIVALVRLTEVQEAKTFMHQVMSTPPLWAPDLPVACDVGFGTSYGSAK